MLDRAYGRPTPSTQVEGAKVDEVEVAVDAEIARLLQELGSRQPGAN